MQFETDYDSNDSGSGSGDYWCVWACGGPRIILNQSINVNNNGKK